MKNILAILLINAMSVHVSGSQTLIQQIENAYNALDTASYIENVILSYKKDKLKGIRETQDVMLEFRGIYNNMDSIRRQNTLDCVMERYNTWVSSLSYREDLTKRQTWEEIHATYMKSIAYAYLNIDCSIQKHNIIDSISKDFSKISIERDYSMFISAIKDKSVRYVLNLVPKEEQTLQVDTGELAFNLFYFDRRNKLDFFVIVENGIYVHDDTCYRVAIPTAHTRKIARNAPEVFGKIMRKNPEYLLYCHKLEGMNTILYVLNDKIYVYRIAQMKEYELSDYLKNFPISLSITNNL
jgi:hypothetical protein